MIKVQEEWLKFLETDFADTPEDLQRTISKFEEFAKRFDAVFEFQGYEQVRNCSWAQDEARFARQKAEELRALLE